MRSIFVAFATYFDLKYCCCLNDFYCAVFFCFVVSVEKWLCLMWERYLLYLFFVFFYIETLFVGKVLIEWCFFVFCRC
jgi:hypothetical protein